MIHPAHSSLRRLIGSGVLVGIGVAGFLDETIFHQLLHWHHFWDGGSPGAGLVADGVFHAFSWISLVVGLLWYAELRWRSSPELGAWAAGILLGTGGFNLYDGTIQHKVLHLHQIRYGVTLWPYDVAWDLAAILLLLAGWLLLRRVRR